jgi:hypothetical protein
MADAFTSRLPSSPRRCGGLIVPFFQTVRAEKIYRFSVNFLRFPPFFETGVPLRKYHFLTFSSSRLRGFA